MLELKLGHFYKLSDYLLHELDVKSPIVKIVAKTGTNCSIQDTSGRVFTLTTKLLADNMSVARTTSNFSGIINRREENVPSTVPDSDSTPEPTSPSAPESEPSDTTPSESTEPETSPEQDSTVPEEETSPEENTIPDTQPEETTPEEEPVEPTQPDQPEPEDNPYGSDPLYDDNPYGDDYL